MFIENRIRVLVIHDRQSKGKKLKIVENEIRFFRNRVKRNNFAKRRHDKKMSFNCKYENTAIQA